MTASVSPVATAAPIAIGIPGPEARDPLVLDMATSVTAAGRIRQAAAEGRPIAEGLAIDADGQPTTDPDKAKTLLPLGGPKGSGLGLMFEMLTSILAAAPIQARALGPEQRKRHVANLAMLAIDITAFRPLADFTKDADGLIAVLRALPRQAGFDEITMPGERSSRTEVARRKSGIPIPAKLWEELEGIAKANTVKMPALK